MTGSVFMWRYKFLAHREHILVMVAPSRNRTQDNPVPLYMLPECFGITKRRHFVKQSITNNEQRFLKNCYVYSVSLLYCTEEKYRSPTFPVATTKNLTVETFLLGANFVLEGAKEFFLDGSL